VAFYRVIRLVRLRSLPTLWVRIPGPSALWARCGRPASSPLIPASGSAGVVPSSSSSLPSVAPGPAG